MRQHLPPQQLYERTMTNYTAKSSLALEHLEKVEEAHRKATATTKAALEEGNKAIQWVLDLATLNGMSANRPTLYNARAFIETDYLKAKEELEQVNATVAELGFSSFGNLAKSVRMTTGERRAKKTLTYFEETLPTPFDKIPGEIERLCASVGRPKVERYFTHTFYPKLENWLETEPTQELLEAVETAYQDSSDLEDLVKVYEWVCDRLDGKEVEWTTDLVPVTTLIHSAQQALAGRYGNTLFEDLVSVAEQANWTAERNTVEDLKTAPAGTQLSWVLREFAECTLDRRIQPGLYQAGYAFPDNNRGYIFSDRVTLDLYLECNMAIKAQESQFVTHECAYDCVEHAVRRYEEAGETRSNIRALLARSNPDGAVVELEDCSEELERCLELLSL